MLKNRRNSANVSIFTFGISSASPVTPLSTGFFVDEPTDESVSMTDSPITVNEEAEVESVTVV